MTRRAARLAAWLAAWLLAGSTLASRARADPPAGERVEILRARIERSRDPAARLELARVLLDAGRAREALDELTLTRAIAPGDPAAAVLRARALSALGRLDEAEAALDESLERAAGAEAYALRARIREAGGRIDEAIEDYDAALSVGPSVTLFLARAALQVRAGRLDDAARGCDEALATIGEAALVREAAIAIARARGRPHDALAHAGALIAQAPRAGRWRVLRAELLEALGRRAEAAQERERAHEEAVLRLRQRPSALAWLELGRALLALGRRAEARTALEQSLRLSSALPEAHVLMARAR